MPFSHKDRWLSAYILRKKDPELNHHQQTGWVGKVNMAQEWPRDKEAAKLQFAGNMIWRQHGKAQYHSAGRTHSNNISLPALLPSSNICSYVLENIFHWFTRSELIRPKAEESGTFISSRSKLFDPDMCSRPCNGFATFGANSWFQEMKCRFLGKIKLSPEVVWKRSEPNAPLFLLTGKFKWFMRPQISSWMSIHLQQT